MAKPPLIIGANGQLARAFRALLPDALVLGRAQADLAQPDRLSEALEACDPSAIINAAAYTQVDNAESEPELAMEVNCQSPVAMAIFCAGRRIPFVHFSSDYVLGGEGEAFQNEAAAPHPLGEYGRSKLAGENAIARIGGQHLIFRTSWVYDAVGKNFFNTILRLASEREQLRIVADQVGAPTYAPHLAAATLAALDVAMDLAEFPSGLYHLCHMGAVSWHGFASQIVTQARELGFPVRTTRIDAITTEEYPLPAKRPRNSRLDCAKAESMFGIRLPYWQEGLRACFEIACEHHRLSA